MSFHRAFGRSAATLLRPLSKPIPGPYITCRPQFRLPAQRPRAIFPLRTPSFQHLFSTSTINNSDTPTSASDATSKDSASTPAHSAEPSAQSSAPAAWPNATPTRTDVPHYQLTFTCKPCLTRSQHVVSKQGYHQGTVLISCPNCKARHLISDHLKIFSDKSVTLEDILREKGQTLEKRTISQEGDIEFLDNEAAAPAAETAVNEK